MARASKNKTRPHIQILILLTGFCLRFTLAHRGGRRSGRVGAISVPQLHLGKNLGRQDAQVRFADLIASDRCDHTSKQKTTELAGPKEREEDPRQRGGCRALGQSLHERHCGARWPGSGAAARPSKLKRRARRGTFGPVRITSADPNTKQEKKKKKKKAISSAQGHSPPNELFHGSPEGSRGRKAPTEHRETRAVLLH
jgi:hypothetical protein